MKDPFNLFPVSAETPDAASFSAETSEQSVPIEPIPLPVPLPIPLPLVKNPVSGRYRGTVSPYQLELRVDVDGSRPCNRISGDYYSTGGGVTSYFGSFKTGAVSIVWGATSVTITGTISATWVTSFIVIRVTIPRTNLFAPRAAATVAFSTTSGNAGTTYVCPFESVYFHTLNLELDYEAGTSLFGSYNTGTLPHGGTARVLDVVSSYAEAGIQLVKTAKTDAVPTAESGANAIWTNAELEAAMHNHFSIVSDSPKWQTYLLACKSKHEQTTGGSTLFGIMFDYSGTSQRQGCAVFQTQINSYYGGAGSNDANRHTLYCYVHELSHSFNLLHSWDKARPNALSWMNYDWKYDAVPGHGTGSFWANFAFQFDDQELLHLRHDFRNSVIMGGDNWATNAGLSTDETPIDFTKPMVENNSGLSLEISSKEAFKLGEPVVVEIRLSLQSSKSKRVNACLHPNFEFVRIAIRKPDGEIITYEPLADHLISPKMVTLGKSKPAIYESAYIGYGRDGFYFDQPGRYRLKAAYQTAEGAFLCSDDIEIRVNTPVTEADADIANLYSGDEQGKLFYLLGSDAAHLQKGNDAFDAVLQKYPGHPLSVYAALAQSVNASRDFKTVGPDNKVTVRPHNLAASNELTQKVFDMSREGKGVDNITLNYALRKNSECKIKSGDKEAAKQTLGEMKSYFAAQYLRPSVLEHIDEQISRTLDEEFNG